MTRRHGLRLLLVTGSLLALSMALAGNDGPRCEPVAPGDEACMTADQCSGEPEINCVGYWTCVDATCVWECDSGPTPAQELCDETGGTWTECGEGCGPWACGTPIPHVCDAVCVAMCGCPADRPGWSPSEGCVPCDCGEWSTTWAAELALVQACTDAEQCVDVPGTSCGCTRNLVVNQGADLSTFWNINEWMNQAGCGLASTCDCPAADGFACEDGVCAWNYTGW
jgi:hypothetical protein